MANIPPPRPATKKGKGAPPALLQTVGNLDKPEPESYKPLNFKVSPDFHRDFKLYAAQHGLSMVEVLQQGFELVKAHRGN